MVKKLKYFIYTKFQGLMEFFNPYPLVSDKTGFHELFINKINPNNGWMSENCCFGLYTFSSLIDAPRCIVEIGSYEGRSTVAIALSPSNSKVFAVDPHTGDRSEVDNGIEVDTWVNFNHNIANSGVIDRIRPLRMKSVEASIRWNLSFSSLETNGSIGLLFIDGWHSTEAVIEDFMSWEKYTSDLCTIVFDDWGDAEVFAGILSVKEKLPPILGSVGKLLIFSNDPKVLECPIGGWALRKTRFLKALSNLPFLKKMWQIPLISEFR
jgi:hypothetical protein